MQRRTREDAMHEKGVGEGLPREDFLHHFLRHGASGQGETGERRPVVHELKVAEIEPVDSILPKAVPAGIAELQRA